MKCRIDAPYPCMDGIQKNPEIARFIMHSYAGDVSEDTAIHQYLFQSILLKDKNPEISSILEEISQVEMHHFSLLAQLIKTLGVYPVYLDFTVDKNEFWTSKYVSYETDLFGMLMRDINSEKQAIQQYHTLIHVISDELVTEVLKRIVLDEQLHLEIFEKLLQSIS